MSHSVFSSSRNPVLYIAEVGGNHEGDFAYAQALARLALESGADAVKFQLYSGDTLVSRVESPDRNRHFKAFELSRENYLELADFCRTAGGIFMASVWDAAMLPWIDPHLPIHKVGSGDLTCFPLIERLVATGKPLILSTGLASLEEVALTVDYIETLDPSYRGERKLALLQCTAAYPTPDGEAHVNAMLALRDRFDLPVGYSDHTLGSEAVAAAVALGAEIIEKHFTDTREGKSFRDHQVSLTGDEVRELLPRLARIKTLLGRREKRLTPAERADDHQISFRRSVYAAKEIAAGETFSAENLTVLRPRHGVCASRFREVLGQRAKRAFAAHEVIREEDLDRP